MARVFWVALAGTVVACGPPQVAPGARTTPSRRVEAPATARPRPPVRRARVVAPPDGRWRLPAPARRLRWLTAAAPAGVRLSVDAGAPVPLRGRVAQIGVIRWAASGLPSAPVEVLLPGGWVRGRVPLNQLEIPVPRGTPLYASLEGEVVGMAIGPLPVRPLLRRGARVLVRIRIREGCGGSVRLWVQPDALLAAAPSRPVSAAWRKPAGAGTRVTCVTRSLEMRAAPDMKPLLVLPLCSVLGYELHVVERKRIKRARWWRLRYRPGQKSSLVLRGWMERPVVRRAVKRSCSCHCVRRTSGIPAERPRYHARLKRAVPLRRRPDARRSSVGRLNPGCRLERPEPLGRDTSGPPGWMRIYLRGQPFYAPYRPGVYVVDQGR